MFGQTTTRPAIAIFSLKSYLPFDALPVWQDVRGLPLEVQQQRFGDPEVRRQLVAAEAGMKPRDNVLQGDGGATLSAESRWHCRDHCQWRGGDGGRRVHREFRRPSAQRTVGEREKEE